ncbi:MAG: DUF2189 domain-containing protein [Mesorhizobium sp.]|nr:DUF2189 domain-containing protein [Mesorhizobium sp.]MBL8580242.1 DUF2189 domain-containing protein [Mesorhizobium sp.]
MSFHVIAGAADTVDHVSVRRIGVNDLFDALRKGLADFLAKPSHIVFIIVMYPIIGVFLAAWTSANEQLLPLLFPLMSGFALIGPFAALGLYEISRRREQGIDASWSHALDIRHSPALPSIAAVGAMLVAIFIAWLLVAQSLYVHAFGPTPPATLSGFMRDIFTTESGRMLLVAGNLVGLGFAMLVLCTTVIAFPLLLDRDVGAYEAIHASVRAVALNPVPMVTWGLIVAVLLAIGSVPLFAGLVVVLPVLGHATWHLYRKVIEPGRGQIAHETNR